MRVGIAILAVNITNGPGRVLYVAGSEFLVKRYGGRSFFDCFIMKDKGEFLKKSEK